MGLLYAIFSIFITLFFPKQITDVICYGRHRDRENIKSKKIYCLICVFWTLFFGLFCLMMGSASGVNNTFDRGLIVIQDSIPAILDKCKRKVWIFFYK